MSAPQAKKILARTRHFANENDAKVHPNGRWPAPSQRSRFSRALWSASPLGLLLVLLRRLLPRPCQQHCCRAFGSHDGTAAARTRPHDVLAVCTSSCSPSCTARARVSAVARRGAAAYGDASRRLFEARTPL